MFRSILFAAVCALTLSGTAQSATLFFGEDLSPGGTVPAGGNAATARASFLSSLAGVGNEDFEGFGVNTAANGMVLNFPGSSGAITATISGAPGAYVDNSPGAGRFATSGSQYLAEVREGFNLAFSTEIAAFGFYGTDIGDFGGQLTLALSNGSTVDYLIPHTVGSNGSTSGSLLFWGIIAGAGETFDNILFGTTTSSDAFGFDDMVIGDLQQVVVPLPAALPLFAAGLGLFGLLGRRRKKTAIAA